jgi:hypothetical protein
MVFCLVLRRGMVVGMLVAFDDSRGQQIRLNTGPTMVDDKAANT